jgi:hypothetical protein
MCVELPELIGKLKVKMGRARIAEPLRFLNRGVFKLWVKER